MDTKFLNVKYMYKKLRYFFFSVTSPDRKLQIEAETCGEDRRDAVSLQDYILYQKGGYFYLSIDQMIM